MPATCFDALLPFPRCIDFCTWILSGSYSCATGEEGVQTPIRDKWGGVVLGDKLARTKSRWTRNRPLIAQRRGERKPRLEKVFKKCKLDKSIVCSQRGIQRVRKETLLLCILESTKYRNHFTAVAEIHHRHVFESTLDFLSYTKTNEELQTVQKGQLLK